MRRPRSASPRPLPMRASATATSVNVDEPVRGSTPLVGAVAIVVPSTCEVGDVVFPPAVTVAAVVVDVVVVDVDSEVVVTFAVVVVVEGTRQPAFKIAC